MCGRFTLKTAPTEIAAQFLVSLPLPLSKGTMVPRYNIAPTQDVSAIIEREGRSWELFRWGLVPQWSKDVKIGSRLINARGETLREKRSYRSAFEKRRCLVLADGFYEWEKTGSGRQPHYFQQSGGGVMAFAGLWEKWSRETTIHSCTIITTTANNLLAPYHDRMPVILNQSDHEQWLDTDFENTGVLQKLIKPYPAGEMTRHVANRMVNHVKNDTAACLQA